MKNAMTALMTAHLIYYMIMNKTPSLGIAIVLGIILIISDYN